jgi:hypothetical protein
VAQYTVKSRIVFNRANPPPASEFQRMERVAKPLSTVSFRLDPARLLHFVHLR